MSRIKLILAAGAVALLLAACSSQQGGTTPPPSTPGDAPTTAAPTTPPPSTSAPTTGALSGKWNGKYSGAYQGTFVLNWRQSGSKLSGTIKISSPADTLPIHGTVQGNVIKFGTVGSVGIQYSGTVSGNSMSGTYKVLTSGSSVGGPWSANKS